MNHDHVVYEYMGAECSKLRQPMRAILALSRAQLLLIVVTRSRDLSRECHVTKHKTPAKSNFPMSNFENSGTIQFSSSRSTSRGLCPKNFEKRAHPNNEAILDGSHPIVVTSIGSSRTLQFWDSGSEHSGTLMKEVRIVQGDLLIMKPHCQDVLWHKVLPNHSTSQSGIRYALSFRRMANATSSNQQEQQPELPHLITSSPVEKDLEPHPETGVMVHPSRLQQQQQQQQPSVKANTLTTPLADNNNSNKNHARHLIIGDSMVNGLHVSGSTCIFRGGIRPHEVLGLLPSSMDLLHPKHYDDVRSVTLVVGTNALNISYPSKATPLLDVVDDYERLVECG